MDDFNKIYDKVNGPMYQDVAPPIQYDFLSYVKQITSSPVINMEGGCGHELRPITDEDMCRYAADDVVNHYHKKHQGSSPSKMGAPLTDKQFKKFMGQTW